MTKFSKPTSGHRSAMRRFSARSRAWMFTALSALTGLGLVEGLAAPQPAAAQASWPGSTTTTVAGTQPTAPGAARGTVHHHIAEPGTNQVMTVPDRSTLNSVQVVTRVPSGHLADGWGLVDTGAGGGFYQLRNLGSGLCLEIPGQQAPSGTAAQQYQCDATAANQPNQLWERISKGGNLYVLRNKATRLTLFRGEDGRVVQSSRSTAWAFQSPEDVQLACTGANYSGACIGSIRSSYGPAPDLYQWAMPFSHLDIAPVGGKQIWSVFIGGPFRIGEVVLFSGPAFTGTCQQFGASDPDLSNNVSSIDQLPRPSSAIMDFRCPPPTGIMLCDEPQFRGDCVTVEANDGDLRRITSGGINTRFNDVTSSIYMTAGNTAALYSDFDFEGTCETLTVSDLNLQDNMIGDNRVSSVWLGHRCDQDVQLCGGANQTGRCVSFRADKPSLRLTDIGNDAASSVRVPAGWQISVWSDDNYLGLVDALNGPITRNFGAGAGTTDYGALTVTGVPDNSASSLDIRIQPSDSNPCTDRFGCLAEGI